VFNNPTPPCEYSSEGQQATTSAAGLKRPTTVHHFLDTILPKRRATRRLAAATAGKHSAELLWQRHYSTGSCITAGFTEAPSLV